MWVNYFSARRGFPVNSLVLHQARARWNFFRYVAGAGSNFQERFLQQSLLNEVLRRDKIYVYRPLCNASLRPYRMLL